jgi:hypothetical protein
MTFLKTVASSFISQFKSETEILKESLEEYKKQVAAIIDHEIEQLYYESLGSSTDPDVILSDEPLKLVDMSAFEASERYNKIIDSLSLKEIL